MYYGSNVHQCYYAQDDYDGMFGSQTWSTGFPSWIAWDFIDLNATIAEEDKSITIRFGCMDDFGTLFESSLSVVR